MLEGIVERNQLNCTAKFRCRHGGPESAGAGQRARACMSKQSRVVQCPSSDRVTAPGASCALQWTRRAMAFSPSWTLLLVLNVSCPSDCVVFRRKTPTSRSLIRTPAKRSAAKGSVGRNPQSIGNTSFSVTEPIAAWFGRKETKAIQRPKIGAAAASEVRSPLLNPFDTERNLGAVRAQCGVCNMKVAVDSNCCELVSAQVFPGNREITGNILHFGSNLLDMAQILSQISMIYGKIPCVFKQGIF